MYRHSSVQYNSNVTFDNTVITTQAYTATWKHERTKDTDLHLIYKTEQQAIKVYMATQNHRDYMRN